MVIREILPQCSHVKIEIKKWRRNLAHPTPSEPFKVWGIDIYETLVSSNNANTYVFTAVGDFSMFCFSLCH